MNIDSTNLETLIKRYALGQLSENDAEAFESYYLARPDLIEKIDATQKIVMGLETLNADQVTESVRLDTVLSNSTRDERSLFHRLFGWLAVPVPAYAMLAVCAIFGPLALNNTGSNQIGEMPVQLVRLDAPSVRSVENGGSQEDGGVNLYREGKKSAVMIRVRAVDYPKYKLAVSSNGSSAVLWTSDAFEFTSGARDHLILLPQQASIDGADVQLLGVGEDGKQIAVPFCNYTEACF